LVKITLQWRFTTPDPAFFGFRILNVDIYTICSQWMPAMITRKIPSRFICFGEILWDNLPSGRKPGGAPMNAAVQLNNLGQNARLISRVGNDAEGRDLLDFLKEMGLSTGLIQVDEHNPTGYVEVVYGDGEDVHYDIARPVAWDEIKTDDRSAEAVRKSEVLVFGSLACRSETSRSTLLSLLEQAGTRVFDLNFRPPYYSWDIVDRLIRLSDIVKLNESEFVEWLDFTGKSDWMEEEAMEWLRTHYDLEAVIITRGSQGAWLKEQGIFLSQAGFAINLADPVGSGDAFLAAYLAARAEGWHAAERLRYACAAGAMVAAEFGAVPSLTPASVREFTDRQQ
jgi:fructokinase